MSGVEREQVDVYRRCPPQTLPIYDSAPPPGTPDWDEVQQRVAARRTSFRARAAVELAEFGIRGVDSLGILLRDREASVRAKAIEALGRIDAPAALDQLAIAIDDPAFPVRKACITAIGRMGVAGADDVLLAALKDRDLQALVAAELARRGNPRALQPLVGALRDTQVGRSPRVQLLCGVLLIALYAAIWGLIVTGQLGDRGVALISICGTWCFQYNRNQRRRSATAVAIVQAITRLSETYPQPEVRNLIPDLNTIARDPLHHSAEARSAVREAARRIERLTESVAQLPRPAGSPATTEDLPRVHLSEPDFERLDLANDRLQFSGPAREASRAAAERIEAMSPVVPDLPLPSGAPAPVFESLPVPSVTEMVALEHIER